MQAFNTIALSILFLFSCISISFSVPHISGEHVAGQPKDGVHSMSLELQILRTLSFSEEHVKKAISPTGTKRVAVILVNFTSAGEGTSGEPDMSKNPGYSKIREYLLDFVQYYREVSYGKLNIEISTFPSDNSAYTLPHPMSYYGAPDIDVDENSYKLIKDALDIANRNNARINKTNFDAIIVLHAGYGQETTGLEGDIWSMFAKWKKRIPLYGFMEGSIVPALEKNAHPLGTICHEFGHQLGLPDLYDTASDKSVVGKWCLMDAGCWAGTPPGSNPAHLSAWCKQLLGWVTPVTITSTTYNLSSYPVALYDNSEDKKSVYKVLLSTSKYLLTEYRIIDYPTLLFDKYIPNYGLLIWRINDAVGNIEENEINTDSKNLRVDLIEADQSDASFNKGDAGDTFPGEKNVTTYTYYPVNDSELPKNIIYIIDKISNYVDYLSYDVLIQTAPLFSIKGHVLNSKGKGLSNILLELSGIKTTTYVTADDGYYEFTNLFSYNYELRPLPPVGTYIQFEPPKRTYSPLDKDEEEQNFVGYFSSCSIIGRVHNSLNKGIPNVKVMLSGTVQQTFTTDKDGYYSFHGLVSSGIYTVKVYKEGWQFSPSERTYTDDLLPITDKQDFLGYTFYSVEGHIFYAYDITKRVSDVEVILSGDRNEICITDQNGYYKFELLSSSCNYKITPVKAGYNFYPSYYEYKFVEVPQKEQNFEAVRNFPSTSTIAESFCLYPPYPNPFNPGKGQKLVIKYDIPREGNVSIKIYNIAGEIVNTLVDRIFYLPGEYVTEWEGKNYQGSITSAGVYMLIMNTPTFSQKQKVIVIK